MNPETNNVRSVEEVVAEITEWNENVGSICYPSDVETRIAQDRQQVLEAVYGVLDGLIIVEDYPSYDEEVKARCLEDDSHYNRALQQAKTTIKDLLDDNK